MPRIMAAIAISLAAGIAVGAWLLSGTSISQTGSKVDAPALRDDASTSMDERLQRLEKDLAEERRARMVLEDQLQALLEVIERVESAIPRASADQQAVLDQIRAERRSASRSSRDFVSMMRGFQERRLNMLIDGGFSEDEARRVLEMESAAQYEAMQAAHAAQRRGEANDPFFAGSGSQSLLRGKLGDSEYERYLAAQGQPTAIQVTRVLDSSPGDRAGIQPGDRIISYNGARVFSVSDLRALTLQGNAGEDVVIEIEREGVPMQLNLPRGPVGITGSSANIRGMNWWGGT